MMWSQRLRRTVMGVIDTLTGPMMATPSQATRPLHPSPSQPRRIPRAIPQVPVHQVRALCVAYQLDGKHREVLPLQQAIRGAGRGRFTWIHLDQAQPGEVEAIAAQLHLPALAVEDAVKAHQRPKVELYPRSGQPPMIFAVVKPARYQGENTHTDEVVVDEVALFISPDWVVSVSPIPCPVIHQVRQELDHPHARDAQAHLGLTAVPGPMGVLYRVLDLTVDDYEAALARIETAVDDLETAVFGPQTADHTQSIYQLKRQVAQFCRAAIPLGQVLTQLVGKPIPGLTDKALPYFNDVHDHTQRSADALDGNDRRLSDILQADLARTAAEQSATATRQAQISNQQNEDMRKISAWAAIALVPTAIAGVYGMNFEHMPELSWHYGYPAVLVVIATLCVTLHRIFHRNGWL